MQTIDELLAEVPAFEGMAPEQLELIAGCAANRVFDERRVPASARASRPTPST